MNRSEYENTYRKSLKANLGVEVPDSVIWESLKGRISDEWITKIRREILRRERNDLHEMQHSLIDPGSEDYIIQRLNDIGRELQSLI